MRFEGRTAIVTGAASGLGRAVSQLLSSEGARIFGVDLNEAGLAETRDLVVAAGGSMSTGIGDISDRMTAHGLVANAMDELGQIDSLINCAGVMRAGNVTDFDEAAVNLMFNVNVHGSLWMMQAAIPHLIDSRGSIVNVASNSALMGAPFNAVYSASKGAIVSLTRSVAMEYVKKGIRVNAVAPGGINTPMMVIDTFPPDTDWKLMEPMMGHRPASQPEEIAAVIAFLASDDASAVHGAIYSVDQGLTAA
ncbi:MAG: SDR family oxidoreductase [Actinobacteria bacterium]|nr:SDR family oxidoreductase [Actinomycetota bacterium]